MDLLSVGTGRQGKVGEHSLALWNVTLLKASKAWRGQQVTKD